MPDKKEFYNNVNMKNITAVDYKLEKKSMKKFWNKKCRWTLGLVRSKWYIITCRCIWKLSRQMYWSIWAWSSSFFINTRISMASIFEKKTGVELELLTDTDMLLMKKSIRGRICHAIHR